MAGETPPAIYACLDGPSEAASCRLLSVSWSTWAGGIFQNLRGSPKHGACFTELPVFESSPMLCSGYSAGPRDESSQARFHAMRYLPYRSSSEPSMWNSRIDLSLLTCISHTKSAPRPKLLSRRAL
jgi:hypothetical protein